MAYSRHVLRFAMPLLTVGLLFLALFAGRPADEDDAQRALRTAAELHSQGELEASLQWIARAQELIVLELETNGDRLACSNAGALLDVLAVYGQFAFGDDPDLDAEYEAVSDLLTTVFEIERMDPRPHRIGDLDIGVLGDGLVHRFGRVDVGHLSGGLIHRIGKFDIGYLGQGQPHRIGRIDIAYRGDGSIHRIGKTDIH